MRRQDALTCKPTPMWRRALAWITSLAMVLMFVPAIAIPLPAWAEDATDGTGVTYLDAGGKEQTCTDYVEVKSSSSDIVSWGQDDGGTHWYVAEGDIAIRGSVAINGNVNLILENDCSLTVTGGIRVKNFIFSIYAQPKNGDAATGQLDITSPGQYKAGIGGNGNEPAGTINIHGGIINTQGGEGAAGIGAAKGASKPSPCSAVIITGGIVKAIGGSNSAGIGGGGNSTADCGSITISGGVVTATNGDSDVACAIGNGGRISASATSSSCKNLNISGDAVVFADSYGATNASVNNCIIFDTNGGKLYGDAVKPKASFEINSTQKLTIDAGQTLVIPTNISVANSGTITNNGIIRVMNGGSLSGTVGGTNAYAAILESNGCVDLGDIVKATYGAEVNLPSPSSIKAGYTFGWFDNASLTGQSFTAAPKATGSDVTYYAGFVPNTDTAYKTEYYKQKADRSGYELAETENKTGTTDTTVTASVKSYDGFVQNSGASGTVSSGNIAGDGSLVLKLYYDRIYDVSVTLGEGMTSSGDLKQENLPGAMTSVTVTAENSYYFPDNYATGISPTSGVTVTRDSYTQATISGMPINNVNLTLPDATRKTEMATPTATFTAAGPDNGTLSGVNTGMQYSLNYGSTWTDINGTSINLTGLSAGAIQVKAKGSETAFESDVQTIEIQKAGTPTGVTAKSSTGTAADGALLGTTTAMEYSKAGESSWVDCSSDSTAGLAAGKYQVRVKATGSTLASDSQTATIGIYAAKLTKSGDTTSSYYDDLGAAITEAGKSSADCTVKLLRDVECAKDVSFVIESWSNKLVVDLNGKTLSTNADLIFYVKNTNALSVINTATQQAKVVAARAFHIESSGTVTIGKEGGSCSDIAFDLKNDNSINKSILVTSSSGSSSSITIYGGTYNARNVCALIISKTIDRGVAKAILYGGTFDGISVETGTLSDTLAEGYAFKKAGNWVNDLSGKTLNGVSVTKAPIQGVSVTADKTTITYGETVTLTTAATVQSGGVAEYQWYDGNKALEGKTSSTLVVSNLTAGTHNLNCSMSYDGYTVNRAVSVTVDPKSLDDSMAADIVSATYTGSDITPTVTVTDGETTLKAGTDYTVAYENNHNAGNATAKVTGIGNYTGTITKGFVINKADGSVTAPAAKTLTYNGTDQTLISAASSDTGTVQYKLGEGSWSENIPVAKDAGDYIVHYQVIGDGNHNNVAEANVKMTIAKATVTVAAKNRNVYVGSAAPDLSKPELNRDYTVTGLYDNNQLDTAPTLKYADANGKEITTPDTSKSGTAARIVASGSTASNNYDIVYTEGKLTVSIPYIPSPAPDPKPEPKPDPTPDPGTTGSEVSGTDGSGNKVSGTVVGTEEVKLPSGGTADGSIEFTGTTGGSSGTGGSTPSEPGSGSDQPAAPITSVKVPETVTAGDKTYAVVKVADNAFAGQKELTEVTLPETIAEIGKNAFKGCEKLTSIDIASTTISKIADGAFANTGVAAIELPKTATTIGKSAFENCKDLVTVKSDATKIESNAFAGCESLKKVTSKAKTVGAEAFKNCTSLVKVDFSKATSIGAKAFSGCKELEKATLGTGLKSIGKEAFKGCSNLKSLTITSKQLSKKQIAQCLKDSKIERIVVQVGTKKQNQKYADKYAKLFTKKIAGKKASVKASKKPLKK